MLWRIRWVPPAREASEILDGLDSGGRLIASGRTLIDALAPVEKMPHPVATVVRDWVAAEAAGFRAGVAAARARLAVAAARRGADRARRRPRADAVRARVMAARRGCAVLAAVALGGCGGQSAPPKPPPVGLGKAAMVHLRALARIGARNGQHARGRDARLRRVGRSTSPDDCAPRATACGSRRSRIPMFRERSQPRLEVGGRADPGRDAELLAAGARPGAARARRPRLPARATSAPRAAGSRSSSAGACTFRVKARLAQAAGARGLVVADRGSASPPGGSLGRPGIRIPAVAVGAAGLALRGRGAAGGRHRRPGRGARAT